MHKVGIVDEQHERGRVGRRLSAVIYPKPSAFIGRRLGNGYSLGYYVVQRACGYARAVLAVCFVCNLHNLVHTLPRKCGYEYHRHIIHECKVNGQFFLKFVHGVGILLDKVPFVYHKDTRFALFMNVASDAHILLA